MPYILKVDRPKFQPMIDRVVEGFQKVKDLEIRVERLCMWVSGMVVKFPECYTRGEVNYIVTEVCVGSMDMKNGPYDRLNDAIGLLDYVASYLTDMPRRGIIRCAQLEMYRRLVAPYEDGKINKEENGDIAAYLT